MKTTSSAGSEAVLFRLSREIGNYPVIAEFSFDGEPVSKSRARFTKRGSKAFAYTPERTRAAEERVAWAFRSARKGWKADAENMYGVMVVFFNGTRQRRDVDNMVKLLLDGLNGVCWADDSQVMEVSARKVAATKDQARTEVMIYQLGPMILEKLTDNCEYCGKAYITYESHLGRRKYCSRECAYAHRITRKTITCLNCGDDFLAHVAEEAKTRKYCSRECWSEHARIDVDCSICGTTINRPRSLAKGRNYCSDECVRENDRIVHKERRTKHFPGKCLICGAGTTRKEYKRCNPCKRAGKTVERDGIPF